MKTMSVNPACRMLLWAVALVGAGALLALCAPAKPVENPWAAISAQTLEEFLGVTGASAASTQSGAAAAKPNPSYAASGTDDSSSKNLTITIGGMEPTSAVIEGATRSR